MIIDVMLIGIIALAAIVGFRRGFVLTVSRLGGALVAFFLAKMYAPRLTDTLVSTSLGAYLLKIIREKVIIMMPNLFNESLAHYASHYLPYSWSEKLLERFSIDGTSADMASWMAFNIMMLLVMAGILLVLLIAIEAAMKIVTKSLDHMPLLGLANRGLGAVAGIFGGILIAFVFALVLAAVAPLTPALAPHIQTSKLVSWFSSTVIF